MDTIVLKTEALPISERKRFAHICPDFVIELKSETDSSKQLKEKMEEWIDNGCRLGWLIDPEDRRVFIYRPNGEFSECSFDEKITGETVLPGFVLDLSFIDEMMND